MSELSNEYIEEAFAQIRARFEKRNNETGLEMLDGQEEQWAATGSLSDRQYEWLKKQLDGTWMQKAGPVSKSENDGGETIVREPDVIPFPVIERDLERRIDAMISRKLEKSGTTVVDLAQLDELEEVIDGLKRVIRAMR